MMHHGSFDLLDLKIRMPPQLAQRLNVQSASQQQPPIHNHDMHNHLVLSNHHNDIAPVSHDRKQKNVTPMNAEEESPTPMDSLWIETIVLMLSKGYMPMIACIVSLIPFFCVLNNQYSIDPLVSSSSGILASKESSRVKHCGCLYLMFVPFTTPILIGFNLCHVNSKWYTLMLAYLSLSIGNVAAVAYCSSSTLICTGIICLWLISIAVIIGGLQLLLLINKSNVVLVVISTASTVIVCCLALVAPFLPNSHLSYRCYQSTSLPFLWLFFQACSAKRYTPRKKELVIPSNLL